MIIKYELKGNPNYCATIVEIVNLIPLENCDNIQGTQIFGNHVIVSKDIEIGDRGVFFPVGTSIKQTFLSSNNLYRDKVLNTDKEKAGFFELNGRVRCMKLRGHKSEGFWIPIDSLNYIIDNYVVDLPETTIGLEFDHINNVMICEKYFIPTKGQPSQKKGNKRDNKLKRFDKIIEGQFHFHIDTLALGRNIHKINLNDIISITEKLHGTSAIFSNVLCNKKLTLRDRIAKMFGVNVKITEYDNLYSSRTVLKNRYLTTNSGGFYNEDIWGKVNKELQSFLQKGMTIYAEIVGYLESGKTIQKGYDYGCDPGKHETYIYRITSTDADGKVFEWSMLQVQQWCKEKGLKAVPLHYYGTVENLLSKYNWEYADSRGNELENWRNSFLNLITELYLEKKCYICKNDVPNEGVVLRLETLDIQSYKHKSFLFKARESKEADEGISNIEDDQSQEVI